MYLWRKLFPIGIYGDPCEGNGLYGTQEAFGQGHLPQIVGDAQFDGLWASTVSLVYVGGCRATRCVFKCSAQIDWLPYDIAAILACLIVSVLLSTNSGLERQVCTAMSRRHGLTAHASSVDEVSPISVRPVGHCLVLSSLYTKVMPVLYFPKVGSSCFLRTVPVQA